MTIVTMFKQVATTSRLLAVGGSSIKKTYQTYLTNVLCHIQPQDSSLSQTLEGSFGKNWMMYCLVQDVKEGDKVTVSSEEYQVMGVQTFDFGNNPHMEITLRLFKE